MHKSRLQEYCQSKAWKLPEYATTKEGFDHCPRFKASVVVNGTTYFSPDFSKSSKDAHNSVAKLAFDLLTGSFNGSSTSTVSTNSSDFQLPKANETEQPPLSGLNAPNRVDKKPKDMTRLYKNQLQVYAQKRNLDLPVYVSEREGPSHAPRFKTKVILEGKTYESQEYFSTVKDAENAAAEIALRAVSSHGTEEEDPGFFKNLLQELAQKNYSCLPEYSTTWSGPSHSPIFISIVEVKEKSFKGQEARTKKLAEMYAAKVAYTALAESKLKQNCQPETTTYHGDDTSHSSSPMFPSNVVAELPQTISAPDLGSNKASVEQAKFGKGANKGDSGCNHVKQELEGSYNINQVTCEVKVEALPIKQEPSSSPDTVAQSPSRSAVRERYEAWTGPHTSQSHKKFKVYPRAENMALPAGATILHKDDKWIAVTMDSIHGNR